MKVEFFSNLLNPDIKINVRSLDGTNLGTMTAAQLKTSQYKGRTVSRWNFSPIQHKDFVVINII